MIAVAFGAYVGFTLGGLLIAGAFAAALIFRRIDAGFAAHTRKARR